MSAERYLNQKKLNVSQKATMCSILKHLAAVFFNLASHSEQASKHDTFSVEEKLSEKYR